MEGLKGGREEGVSVLRNRLALSSPDLLRMLRNSFSRIFGYSLSAISSLEPVLRPKNPVLIFLNLKSNQI